MSEQSTGVTLNNPYTISSPGYSIQVSHTTQLAPHESQQILADPAAMRAVIDGSGTLPEAAGWITFYTHAGDFCGAVALLRILPNPLQPEFHLFYLSSAPRILARPFCELAYIYCLLNRLQPYTVIRATPELQYMHNFMLRLGCMRVPNHGRYYYFHEATWKPRFVPNFHVTLG
jgi:hypothetical protein